MNTKGIGRREALGTIGAAGTATSRGSNPISNASDGIFADSLSSELTTPTGDTTSGYAANFQVGVAL
jgi:hypothetical protein